MNCSLIFDTLLLVYCQNTNHSPLLFSDHSRCGLSQWEEALHNNTFSHWPNNIQNDTCYKSAVLYFKVALDNNMFSWDFCHFLSPPYKTKFHFLSLQWFVITTAGYTFGSGAEVSLVVVLRRKPNQSSTMAFQKNLNSNCFLKIGTISVCCGFVVSHCSVTLNHIQCGAIITWSVFSKILIKDTP